MFSNLQPVFFRRFTQMRRSDRPSGRRHPNRTAGSTPQVPDRPTVRPCARPSDRPAGRALIYSGYGPKKPPRLWAWRPERARVGLVLRALGRRRPQPRQRLHEGGAEVRLLHDDADARAPAPATHPAQRHVEVTCRWRHDARRRGLQHHQAEGRPKDFASHIVRTIVRRVRLPSPLPA